MESRNHFAWIISQQLALTVVAFTCTSTSEIDYYLQAIPPLASLEAIHVQFLIIVFFFNYNGKIYHNIKRIIESAVILVVAF